MLLFDGGLLIQSHLAIAKRISNYGNFAHTLLASACKEIGQEAHILLDTYEPGSLKAQERELRGSTDGVYVITGPEQSPPKVSTDSLMKNSSFKNALGKFLLKEWQQSNYADFIGSKILYVSHGGNCVRIWVPKNTLTTEVPPTDQGIHAEADTLVALHASQIDGDIIVRASDTDIIIILLSMISLHQDQEADIKYQRIVMDCGAGNSRRYIDVSSIHRAMEEKNPGICSALPAVHAITGCDYTAAMFMRGKKKPLKMLIEHDDGPKFIECFREMSRGPEIQSNVVEKYVCHLYGMQNTTKVNKVRKDTLQNLAHCRKTGKKWENIQKVNASLPKGFVATVTASTICFHDVD